MIFRRLSPSLGPLKIVWSQLLSDLGWKQDALLSATAGSQSTQPQIYFFEEQAGP